MREKSKTAVTMKKAILSEQRKLEEDPDDDIAQVQLEAFAAVKDRSLEPVPHLVVAGECLPDASACDDIDVWSPTDTLNHPSSIHQTASIDRLTLAEETGHQELCLDAADTIGASNSLEKMMAHQLAVCHAEGMKLVAKAAKVNDPNVSLKMMSVATRFMEIYQRGFEAIHRVKRGNRQTVVVRYQQVNVTAGGQAVIAESAGGRGRRRGDVEK